MIDFSKITKTLDGYDCHYFGTRESYGVTLHCFGIMHPHLGVRESLYNAEGQRLTLAGGQWFAPPGADFQIVKPKKKVSVTRWLRFESQPLCLDSCLIEVFGEKPCETSATLSIRQHTFTFEVDE